MKKRDCMKLSRTDIRDLDAAFYAASCFAAQSPTNAVTIWSSRNGDDDVYCLIDSSAVPASGDWAPLYTVARRLGDSAADYVPDPAPKKGRTRVAKRVSDRARREATQLREFAATLVAGAEAIEMEN